MRGGLKLYGNARWITAVQKEHMTQDIARIILSPLGEFPQGVDDASGLRGGGEPRSVVGAPIAIASQITSWMEQERFHVLRVKRL